MSDQTLVGKIPRPDDLPKENKKKEGFTISLAEIAVVGAIIFILYLLATR